jgi:hypothetical protein
MHGSRKHVRVILFCAVGLPLSRSVQVEDVELSGFRATLNTAFATPTNLSWLGNSQFYAGESGACGMI